jgi:hypothetical protein
MSFEKAFYAVLVIWFTRELVFLFTTQKLVNKLMSRSFYDYQQAVKVGSDKKSEPKPGKIDDDEPEDLHTLDGIGVL